MTNRFKTLDTIFPCGKDRVFGEVVALSLRFQNGNVWLPTPWSTEYISEAENSRILDGAFFDISWKRKAWYVNASTNAFHMHRGLCREFRDRSSGWHLTNRVRREVYKTVGDLVEHAYRMNNRDDTQYFEASIQIFGRNVVSMFTSLDGVSLVGRIRNTAS